MFLLIQSQRNIFKKVNNIIYSVFIIITGYICTTFLMLLYNYKSTIEILMLNSSAISEYHDHNSVLTIRHSFFSIFLFVIMFIVALIIIYVCVKSLNEKKYKIGVLRAMGISKLKLILYLICENGILMLISFFLGALTAFVLFPLTLKFYDFELYQIQNQLFFVASIPLQVFLYIFGLVLFITIIPALIYILYIIRFSPLKILKNK